MKRFRKSKKILNELYFYLDYISEIKMEDCYNELDKRFIYIKDKYDKKFLNRFGFPDEWYEYYGLFKLGKGKIGIDPKRFDKTIGLDEEKIKIMAKRNTTYFHPKKNKYEDYCVNNFVDSINNLQESYDKFQKPLIKRLIKEIESHELVLPGDYIKFQMGIADVESANNWSIIQNIINDIETTEKKTELFNNLYVQFYHNMVSRIEAITVSVLSKNNPKMKDFNRKLLYDNYNLKKVSSRDLKSFKYHDKMYCIWNFLKHNNLSTYENLLNYYPEVLIKRKFKSGDLAVNYLILNDELINELLDGVKNFFIEWCDLNCDEKYYESSWNYSEWFIRKVKQNIDSIRNPLGLNFLD